MNESCFVRRAAVLGAGVMGAQIAAHLANAGIEALLFELPGDDEDRSRPARDAVAGLKRMQPPPLATTSVSALLQPANYDDDLDRLADCDLVIEAVAERLDVKRALFERIAPKLPPAAMLGSNTSGLSMDELAEALPEGLRARFCGVHFFNPPRYMHLVELIPGRATEPEIVDRLETFLTTTLGKGVVRARDTPNFIANRIGVFAILAAMHHAEALGIPFETVDALTGTLIGRPKSATFRTADVVGLDTLRHVVEGSRERLDEDPWGRWLALPEWMVTLIDRGALGQKSGAGVYRKVGREIHVHDPRSGDYRPMDAVVEPELERIMRDPDPAARFEALRRAESPQARFLWAIHRDVFHYAAFLLGEIADNARDVDLAIRWGFGWRQGPFELWQSAGWTAIGQAIHADIEAARSLATTPLPDWVSRIDAVHIETGSWAPESGSHRAASRLPVYARQRWPEAVSRQDAPPPSSTTFETPAVRLWHLQADPDIGILSFRTRKHAISAEVLDGVMTSVARAEGRYRALVLWQDSEPFSFGADLKQVTTAVEAGDFDTLERIVGRFQQATGCLRRSPLPVVAGVRGMALGGGCEFIMHCDHVVSALESYIGLVEAGVGLIPAGGGSKELARRAAANAPDGDPLPFIRRAFEHVARARVSGSAPEAREMGLLDAGSTVVMHRDEVLHVALAHARALSVSGYRPPPERPLRVAGRDLVATLRASLVNMREGGFISAHDETVAHWAALALCGGDVEGGIEVDEAWLLTLERAAFMALLRTPKTAERISHTLATGKPLRN